MDNRNTSLPSKHWYIVRSVAAGICIDRVLAGSILDLTDWHINLFPALIGDANWCRFGESEIFSCIWLCLEKKYIYIYVKVNLIFKIPFSLYFFFQNYNCFKSLPLFSISKKWVWNKIMTLKKYGFTEECEVWFWLFLLPRISLQQVDPKMFCVRRFTAEIGCQFL